MLFLLARKFNKYEQLTVFSSRYIFDKQKHVTLGFVNLNLPEVRRLSEFYSHLFGKSKVLSNRKLKDIYETEFKFGRACEFGSIGLRAILPKDLEKYMPGRSDKNEYFKLKDDEQSQITYSTYISWILAMLNNKDLMTLAEKATRMLRDYAAGDRNARTVRRNAIETLLSSKNKKELIDSLTAIVQDDSTTADVSNAIVGEVMLNIPLDNIPLFITLLRFKYVVPPTKN